MNVTYEHKKGLTFIGFHTEIAPDEGYQKPLGIWAGICLAAMVIGPIGTGLLPASVFGLFERIGTFSVVVFNAVLGMYLFIGKLESDTIKR